MGKMYPKKSHYIKFQKTGDNVKLKHIITEEEWIMPAPAGEFIKALDGKTNPYGLLDDRYLVKDILKFMASEDLFDDGKRISRLGIGTISFALWIPDVGLKHRVAGFVWNHLLMAAWLPVLIIGILTVIFGNCKYVEGTLWDMIFGVYGGIALGVILHELSHAAAALNYGGVLYEAGIMIQTFIPYAYCMIDCDNVKPRLHRAQINAAGVECNMFLCGCFLCLLKSGVISTDILLYAAGINALLGITNLSLIDGLDGNGIFEEFIGCRQLVPRAKSLISSRARKAKLRKQGINGRAVIAACYIICVLQMLMPMLLIGQAVNIIYAVFNAF